MMADKNDVFVLARRRDDNVVMVLGRKLIAQYPHKFEEVGTTSTKAVKREEVPEIIEETDISMEFNTEQGFTEPETIDEFRAALDKLGVDYKPQHGIPGLRKLYEANK